MNKGPAHIVLEKQEVYEKKQDEPGFWKLFGPNVGLNLPASNNCPLLIPELVQKIKTETGRLYCTFRGHVLTKESHLSLKFYINQLPLDYFCFPENSIGLSDLGSSFQYMCSSWREMGFSKVAKVEKGEHLISVKYSNARDSLLDRAEIQIVFVQDSSF